MFTAIATVAFALSILALLWGAGRARRSGRLAAALPGVIVAAVIGGGTWGGFWLLDFYSEKLWYDSLGYGQRFMTVWTWDALIVLMAGAVGGLVTWCIARVAGAPRILTAAVTLFSIASSAGAVGGLWTDVLLFQNATMTGTLDPLLGKDVGFYLFQLPLLQKLGGLVLLALILGALAAILTLFMVGGSMVLPPALLNLLRRFGTKEIFFQPLTRAPARAALIGFGLIIVTVGYFQFLARYDLVIEGTGFPAGAGYVDSNYLVYARGFMAVVFVLTGLTLVVAEILGGRTAVALPRLSRLALAGVGASVGFWIVALLVIPAVIQRFRVSPNELAAEQPYIQRSIDFTRRAFALDSITERDLPAGNFTPEIAAADKEMLSEVPLWDYRALLKVFSQFQEFRLYYSFLDVDIDRYDFDGVTRQVMIAARELDQTALPAQNRTFLNTRFKYTHGHGVVAVPVAEFTPDGQPRYLVSNIPAQSAVPVLNVTRPEIYFGEMTGNHVYVNSLEPEFDYPHGEQNVEAFYEGTGGVVMNTFVRKLAYAKRFDGMRLLFASHVTDETRVLFRRQIQDRVRAVAPFLILDNDPYIVVSEGRLFWIMDAYTSSANYPYSERISAYGRRMNYLRNSVKIVIDAYNGTTDFYIVEPGDPIINTWSRAIPGLFKPGTELPEGLRSHLRYPEGMLIVQGEVYAKYHMRDLNVFYNNEDLWQPAWEKYYSDQQEVEPYYMLWKEPDVDELEFIQMWTFTPRGRNVMAGWIAGTTDGAENGRLFAYRLPTDRQVSGPLQFEAKIDQHEALAQLMTLWSQGGSNVIRGHVLTIPVNNAIIHIEPIYLESQSSSFPELQLVTVMHGDQFGYGPTLDAALEMLFGQRTPAASATAGEGGDSGAQAPTATTARQASDAFEAYLRLQAQGQFEAAGRELARVRDYLRQLAGEGQ